MTDLLCSPWVTADELCSIYPDLPPDNGLVEAAVQSATEVLYNFTRRRWPGVCSDTIRPCRRGCAGTSGCGCGYLSEFRLPGRPVVAVQEVKVDGQVVPAGEYRVDDRKTLVGLEKADGRLRVWPVCQRLDRADTEERTWSVTYTYGEAPPPGGEQAAKSLGYQLALSFQPDALRDKCRLPRRVTTVTRQNVSMAILDPLTLFKDGQTGLTDVDLWVAAVNRGSDTRSAVVIDPMRHAAARRTT